MCRYIVQLRKLILEERLNGHVTKKTNHAGKDGITGTVSSPLENTNQEQKMKKKPDDHKVVLEKNKTLLQNPNYGSRRKDEKKPGALRVGCKIF